MNILDLSNRRGAIVHMLPQIYKLFKADGIDLPNIILWTQDMRRSVIDINRKWIFALQGTSNVHGLMFYRVGADGKSIYVDHLVSSQSAIIDALLKKFEQSDLVKGAEAFYLGREIKREAKEEAMSSVGLQDDSVFNDEGYQFIGGTKEILAALKLRYMK